MIFGSHEKGRGGNSNELCSRFLTMMWGFRNDIVQICECLRYYDRRPSSFPGPGLPTHSLLNQLAWTFCSSNSLTNSLFSPALASPRIQRSFHAKSAPQTKEYRICIRKTRRGIFSLREV